MRTLFVYNEAVSMKNSEWKKYIETDEGHSEDVPPPKPRKRRKMSKRFLVPLFLLTLFSVSIWYFSNGSTMKIGTQTIESGVRFKGVVLGNSPSASALEGSSNFTVLTETDEITRVYYSRGWGGCSS